jgi:hypothetical protein
MSCDIEFEQLVLGVVTEHAHERRIRRHELAVGGRLEHAGRHVLEEFAIALFGCLQGQHRVRALGRIPQHALDERRTEVVALQEIERAARHGFGADFFFVIADEHHDRHVWRLRLDTQESREPAAVGQRQLEHDHVDAGMLEAAERFSEGRYHFEPIRLTADGGQCVGEARLVGGLGADEQDGGGRHDMPSIRLVRGPDL